MFVLEVVLFEFFDVRIEFLMEDKVLEMVLKILWFIVDEYG